MRELWIGHRCAPPALQPSPERHLLSADRLVQHAVCLGMTGSGKTGLCTALLEEVALAGVPILAIDPKGDLANLALAFPDLTPADFQPWVDPAEALRQGVDVPALAAATAARWSEGLRRSGDDPARLAALRSRTEVRILTPGSRAGVPVDVLAAATTAPAALRDDPEGLVDYAQGATAALLGLVGLDSDPLRDPASILVARLLGDAWMAGEALPIERLLPAIIDPPFQTLGVFPLDSFFPRKDRLALAMQLNAVVASPSFTIWREGEPLDVAALLSPRDGRTPVNVLYLAHLDDTQRMFFVTLFLHAVVAWSRRQPGTGALRALLYFDEVMGFLPPHPRQPPSKAPVLTLMKQARAVGLGVMLCTQNPVDVDYKALANAGTWIIGRMQTRQDREKVIEGLVASGGGLDAAALDASIASLPSRTFVVREAGATSAVFVASRHALVYLRGPLVRTEVEQLRGLGLVRAAEPGSTPATPPPRSGAQERDVLPAPPPLPPGFDVRWLDAAMAWSGPLRPQIAPRARPPRADGRIEHEPAIQVALHLRFVGADGPLAERVEHRFFFPLDRPEPTPLDVEIPEDHLLPVGPAEAACTPLPSFLDEARELERLKKATIDAAVREESTTLLRHPALKLTSRAGEAPEAFRARVAETVQARVDAEVAGLRAAVDRKLQKLQEAVEDAEAKAAAHAREASSLRTEQALSAGQSILGLFFGGRRSLSGVVTKQRQVGRAQDKVAKAEDDAGDAREAIEALQEQVVADIAAIEDRLRPLLDQVEEIAVRVRKADVAVDSFRVVWVPVTRPL